MKRSTYYTCIKIINEQHITSRVIYQSQFNPSCLFNTKLHTVNLVMLCCKSAFHLSIHLKNVLSWTRMQWIHSLSSDTGLETEYRRTLDGTHRMETDSFLLAIQKSQSTFWHVSGILEETHGETSPNILNAFNFGRLQSVFCYTVHVYVKSLALDSTWAPWDHTCVLIYPNIIQ